MGQCKIKQVEIKGESLDLPLALFGDVNVCLWSKVNMIAGVGTVKLTSLLTSIR
jgi:hypothetical protein